MSNKQQIRFTNAYIPGPCKDCTERFVGCHTVCVKYEDYKQTLEAKKELCKAFNESNRIYTEYSCETYKRLTSKKKVQK